MIILTAIISIMLCIGMIGFGVYANINQSYSISNTIGFNPSSDVYVELVCKVTGCKQTDITVPPPGYSSLEEYFEDKGFTKHIKLMKQLVELHKYFQIGIFWKVWNL